MNKTTTDFVTTKDVKDRVGDVFVLVNNNGVDDLWMIISINGVYSLVGLDSGCSWTDESYMCIENVFGGDRFDFEKLPEHSRVTIIIGEG